MSQPSTSLNQFRQQGTELAKNISIFAVDPTHISALRQWLDDAPTYADAEDMGRWGKLLLCLVNTFHDHVNPEPSVSGDSTRLGTYLRRMSQLLPDKWGMPSSPQWLNTKISPYEALHQVLRALGPTQANQGGPKKANQGQFLLRDLMLGNTWSPDDLLIALDGVLEANQKNYPVELRNSALGLLLQALWPRMLDTRWRPADTALYGHMWEACSIGASADDSACAARLARAAPSQNARMLDALLNSTDIAPEAIGAFFPLEAGKCDAYAILDPLIGLLTDGGRDDPTYKALIVAERLGVHNPQLSSLLQMHLTLFPEARETRSMAEMLVPAFNALYGRPVEPPLSLSGDFFEDASAKNGAP